MLYRSDEVVKDRHEITLHSCQSCNRPDAVESDMVECSTCKLWEHFGCAGIDQRIKQADRRYHCKICCSKLGAISKQLPLPAADRPIRSTRASSKRSQQDPTTAASVTSSVRAAILEAQLKNAEEELRRREHDLMEQAEIKKRELEESERQLEEKKKLAEEERSLRERKLKEEKELKAMQSQLRKESMEKRQEIIRQAALNSSRGGSIPESFQKVSDWLEEHTGAGGLEGNPVEDNNVNPHSNKFPINLAQQVGGRNPLISGNSSRRPAALPPQPITHLTPLHSGESPIPAPQEHPNRSPVGFNLNDQRPRQIGWSISNPVVLTQQHIAARQVLGKELPVLEYQRRENTNVLTL
ncbi:uncharacterized protein LOC135707529 [Ochlerotatus camptorhynchus]|uniref:uncharacterized protein LOC135707529 n=1 Tax=Ochlerotatus camptorhynchus TaxID=644619 RepID=UPI0031D84C0A